ncbi:hypothetical protein Tco_0155784 [Tanacetum coccineum]
MPDTANISDSEDTGSAHLLKIKPRPEWLKPKSRRNIDRATSRTLTGSFQHPTIPDFQMEECHKMLTDQIDWTNPEGDQVRIDISRPLPLSGPPALSISKMKAARYHDFGLELLVPEHMWINDLCTYDISASYGIIIVVKSSEFKLH